MLTISQLATYSGVTVRAVRHYHQIGLLPEPDRNHSGYRTYTAADVVQLIRIRTLAEAGVPLSQVQDLLAATPQEFAQGIDDLDKRLRAEIRRLQVHRGRIARLAAGEQLALPPSVVSYLARLRSLGVAEGYLALERDAWIMIAAQLPDRIDEVIAMKLAELDDPDTLELYRLLSQALDWSADDPRIVDLADVLERLMLRSVETGEVGIDELDERFVQLMDATTVQSSPVAERLLAILQERGWKGWTRVERSPTSAHEVDARLSDVGQRAGAPQT